METSCRTVHTRLADPDDTFILIDCREQEEYDFAHLPQSVLLPMSEMQARQAELEAYRGQEIVVLCHHGVRSLQVTAWLQQQGYHATSLSGGIDQWSREIDPSVPRY